MVARRSRSHLAQVAAAYKARHGEALPDRLRKLFKGDLKHALVLLLEPAEAYYAHKLHAALYGLNRTKQLGALDVKTLGRAGRSLYARFEERQSRSGFTPHDDTLVQVIAGRYGRDLSGIIERWRREYTKGLLETIEAKTYGDLSLILTTLLRGCPKHDPEYQARLAAKAETAAAQQQARPVYASESAPPPAYVPPMMAPMMAPPQPFYAPPPQQQPFAPQPFAPQPLAQQAAYAPPPPPVAQPQYGGGYSQPPAQQSYGASAPYQPPPPTAMPTPYAGGGGFGGTLAPLQQPPPQPSSFAQPPLPSFSQPPPQQAAGQVITGGALPPLRAPTYDPRAYSQMATPPAPLGGYREAPPLPGVGASSSSTFPGFLQQ